MSTPTETFDTPGTALATASLVLGIVGLAISFIPCVNLFSFPISILAIIFGACRITQGKGKAGLILGIVAIVAALLMWWIFFDNATVTTVTTTPNGVTTTTTTPDGVTTSTTTTNGVPVETTAP